MARILIIDDEPVIRTIVRQILEDAGFAVIEAENGQIGARLFREQRPDLVITDMMMPVQGGMETIKELRRDFPEVKIIAISGGSPRAGSSLALAREVGAQRTLRKPFSVEELRGAIDDLLGEKTPPSA